MWNGQKICGRRTLVAPNELCFPVFMPCYSPPSLTLGLDTELVNVWLILACGALVNMMQEDERLKLGFCVL